MKAKQLLALAIAMGISGLAQAACGSCRTCPSRHSRGCAQQHTCSKHVTKASGQEFQTILKKHTNVVVKFYSADCQACKDMSPIFAEEAHDFKHKAKFVKVDISQDKAAAQAANVTKTPTFAFYQNGELKGTVVGVMSDDDLEDAIETTLGIED